MSSQYDGEVFAAIGCPREPDHPEPPSPLGRSPSAAVNFRNEIVTGPGGLQSKLKDPSGNQIELFQQAAPRQP
jgi:hypothetical protein